MFRSLATSSLSSTSDLVCRFSDFQKSSASSSFMNANANFLLMSIFENSNPTDGALIIFANKMLSHAALDAACTFFSAYFTAKPMQGIYKKNNSLEVLSHNFLVGWVFLPTTHFSIVYHHLKRKHHYKKGG